MKVGKDFLRLIKLKLSGKDNPYIKALIFVFINVFGSFLALIAVALMISFKTTSAPHAFQLIRNGEVVIICISLIISALYTLYENLKAKQTRITILFWANILIAIMAILFYPLSIEKQVFEIATDQNSGNYIKQYQIIKVASIILLSFTILSLYIIQVIQYQNSTPSALEQRQDQLKSLEEKFNTQTT